MFTSTITIEGRLAVNPTFFDNMTEFVVLTNRRRQDEAGEWVDSDTTRYTVKVFKTLSKRASNLAQGDSVIVAGSITTTQWTDKDTGENRYRQVILADAVGRSL